MEPVDAEAQINDAPSADKTIMLDEGVAAEQPIAVLYSFQTQQHYKLRDDRTIIGRETTCDVVLPDPSVSRRHAEILHNETGWLIRDTGSTNGLIVNGTAATQSRIYDGDIIIVRQTPEARNGEIIVALIEDEATVKTFYNDGGRIRLQPENDTMDPIYPESCAILGKVVRLIRNY